MIQTEFICAPAPGRLSCHAATIVELAGGRLLAAWFAGTHEGHPDVAIWLSRYEAGRWGAPRKVADEPGVPLWNPALFCDAGGTVWLFYKIGPDVPSWSGAYIQSQDGGETWSAPVLLPAGLLGPIKDKPVLLSNGDILCPTSSETWHAWSAWVEISSDGGRTWAKHGPIVAPGFGRGASTPGRDAVVSAVWDTASQSLILPQEHYGVIQPTVWEYAPGQLKMLLRATRRIGAVCAATSDDYGRTWSAAWATSVPNPNSGLDAVRMADGRIALICNPTRDGRSPLSLLLSADNGETWPWRLHLETEPGEYSYPAIIQGADGRLHLVYTYRRTHIRHVALDPSDVTGA